MKNCLKDEENIWKKKNWEYCSQVSKVLGTTMDQRGTAWLDQAQWRPEQKPGAKSPSVQRRWLEITGEALGPCCSVWWEWEFAVELKRIQHINGRGGISMENTKENKWRKLKNLKHGLRSLTTGQFYLQIFRRSPIPSRFCCSLSHRVAPERMGKNISWVLRRSWQVIYWRCSGCWKTKKKVLKNQWDICKEKKKD